MHILIGRGLRAYDKRQTVPVDRSSRSAPGGNLAFALFMELTAAKR
jgi:hypothetical protein